MKRQEQQPTSPKRLVMDELEKKRFQMLPLKLRLRIAELLNQPDLIPPDGRRTRSAALRALKTYEVFTPSDRKKRLCTLEEAAAFVGRPVRELEEFFAKPLVGYMTRKHIFTEQSRFGEIKITKVEPVKELNE